MFQIRVRGGKKGKGKSKKRKTLSVRREARKLRKD
jgi:hypothetical protein